MLYYFGQFDAIPAGVTFLFACVLVVSKERPATIFLFVVMNVILVGGLSAIVFFSTIIRVANGVQKIGPAIDKILRVK